MEAAVNEGYEIIAWKREDVVGTSVYVTRCCLVSAMNIIAGNSDVVEIQVFDNLSEDYVTKDDITLNPREEFHCSLLNKWKGYI